MTPHERSDPEAVELVEALARLCGAVPVRLSPLEHDRAVARTSHIPHLLAALAAGRLAGAPVDHLALSGQGVRDVTRVAGGDPVLYGQIVAANSEAVLDLLAEVRDRLDAVIDAVGAADRAGLQRLLEEGVAGTLAIPGKHGGPTRPTVSVFVSVPDHPGELARLFADAGASEVNIEDVHIDHDQGRPVGLVELVVEEGRAEHLLDSLESRGLGHPPLGLPVVSSAAEGIVVAIDGTSGSGKSSTSRGVADRLGLRYLDTGAMYRAMTWWMLRHGVDVHDPDAVAARCAEPLIETGTDPLAPDHLGGRRGRRQRRTAARRERRGLPGQRGPAGAGPAAGDPAGRHRGGAGRTRDRGRGP